MEESTPIRVLLVEHSQSAADSISRLLQFEEGVHVVGQAATGEKALEMFDSLEPDVVLVDPGLPDMHGLDLTRTIVERNFLAQVVLYGHEASSERILEAMDAGAASYVTHYIQDSRLADGVRKAATRGQRMRGATGPLTPMPNEEEGDPRPEGKLIAVHLGKGGVGVTTVAVNLAVALQGEETPAVLVDGDLQFGDVAALLNLQPVHSLDDLTAQADFLDDELLEQLLLRHDPSGLRVVPAPASPERADDVSAEALGKVLDELLRRYAYVVVDTATYLDEVALHILERADLIVSLLVPDIPSIKNAQLFLRMMGMLGFDKERLLLVMNQLDRRDPIRPDKVSDNLRHPVAHELPYARDEVMRSINRGSPFIAEAKTGPLARALLEVVGEVKERLLVAGRGKA